MKYIYYLILNTNIIPSLCGIKVLNKHEKRIGLEPFFLNASMESMMRHCARPLSLFCMGIMVHSIALSCALKISLT